MAGHEERQRPQQALFHREDLRHWRDDAGEELGEAGSEQRVAQSRTRDLHGALHVVVQHLSHEAGIEIEHAPGSHAPLYRRPVVHLAGIDRDDVARRGFDRPEAAPGAMSAGVQDADAELIVRMPRERTAGGEPDGFDARDSGSVLPGFMKFACHVRATRSSLTERPQSNVCSQTGHAEIPDQEASREAVASMAIADTAHLAKLCQDGRTTPGAIDAVALP